MSRGVVRRDRLFVTGTLVVNSSKTMSREEVRARALALVEDLRVGYLDALLLDIPVSGQPLDRSV